VDDRERGGERASAVPTRPPIGAQARRIVVTVAVAVVALVGLAAWFVAGEAEVEVLGQRVGCDAIVAWPGDDAGRAAREAFEDRCEEAGRARRDRALLIGLGIVVVAAVVSTWPSRRLTGEALGPDR
jgi:hypothetical protein